MDSRVHDGEPLPTIITRLLNSYVQALPQQRGLLRANAKDWYFPAGLVPSDTIRFTSYSGRPGWVKVTGTRKFWSSGKPHFGKYFLSVTLIVMPVQLGAPVVRLRPRVHLTDADGRPLNTRTLVRRRKQLCRNWFNHQWLSRVLGIASWLGGGAAEVRLSSEDSPPVVLSTSPFGISVPVGLRDDNADPAEPDDSEDVIEDDMSADPDEEDDED